MDLNRWHRAHEVFQAALAGRPAEQTALLDEACGSDVDLRAEVESLLSAHEKAEGFLSDPGEDGPVERSLDGTRVGPYRVAQKLGSGGMGVVYLALRADQEFRRRVALKILKPGLDSAEVIRRFRTERQILAALEHPNIARLLDGGTTVDGLPYFVMEYVEGRPIDAWCAEQGLSVRERLELFLAVGSAVELAHRNLVVHRDLKPSNILVTADGVPKLLDFGIAKLLNPELSSATLGATAFGFEPMTPDYASPEQVRGELVTTASDVYSLGVLLYELLAGSHPYRSQATTPAEMKRLVTEADPAKPSTAVAALGGDRLSRQLAGDLDNIVLKALRKEPSRRYASVAQLCDDLRRHLDGLPVLARPWTLGYRTSRFVRRHRVGVAAAATLVLAALAFGVAMGVLAQRMVRERVRAEQERQRAERVTAFLTEIFEVSDPWRSTGETVTAREILDAGAKRLAGELKDEPLVRSELLGAVGKTYQRLGLPDRARPLLEDALATRRTLYGENHPKVADALSDLATVAEEKGQYRTAADLIEKALAIRRRAFGERHETVASSLHRLGLVQTHSGDVEAAEKNLRAALAMRRRLTPPSRLAVAESLNGLGELLWECSRYGEGREVAREALALRREELGRDHVEVASTLYLFARFVAATGDLPQAEDLMRQTLAMRRKLYDGDHPKLAESLNSLGAVLRDQDRLDEAEGLFREAIAMRRRLFGEEHLSVATTLANLGGIAFARGDDATAARLLEESLAIRLKIVGPDHRLVSDSLAGLAAVHERQGNFATAEKELREALRIRRAVFGNQHLQVAFGLEKLARLLARQGRASEAEPLAREALAIVRAMHPVVPAYVEQAERALAECRR